MTNIRPCRETELAAILAIINCAAAAYRGVIPPELWYEPYMHPTQLQDEIAAGVAFFGLVARDELVGVMGIQPMHDVDLLRHAYVRPDYQRQGVGAALLEHLRRQSARQILVGTWAAASWAIDFYHRHGFESVPVELSSQLLKRYWTIPDRQAASSVVLANPPLARISHRDRERWALSSLSRAVLEGNQ